MTYSIVDIQTKAVVGKPYKDKVRARNQANKLDLKYGAFRYIVRPNFTDEVVS